MDFNLKSVYAYVLIWLTWQDYFQKVPLLPWWQNITKKYSTTKEKIITSWQILVFEVSKQLFLAKTSRFGLTGLPFVASLDF